MAEIEIKKADEKTGGGAKKADAAEKASVEKASVEKAAAFGAHTAPEPAAAAGTPAPLVAKDIDPHTYVTVRNGFQGTLVYRSGHTGEKFRWGEFGDEQDMELLELKNAKSSNKKMFLNNYFMFDEEWVLDYLGVRQYYRGAVRIEDFDSLFTMEPAELTEVIRGMSEGQRNSLSYRARQLIASGGIDSRKLIAVLEEALHTELTER